MTDVPASLADALRQLQADLPDIAKTGKGQVGQRTYAYSTLREMTDVLFPRLANLGLAFIAKPTMSGDRFVLAYKLLHVSGQCEEGEYPLALGTPQQHGSAITYGRRYCLAAVTGVASEPDDDGTAAGGEIRTTRKRPPRQRGDETGEVITPAQLTKLAILVKEHGLDQDRDKYLDRLEEITGVRVESSKQLTKAQAHKVIDALTDNPGFET